MIVTTMKANTPVAGSASKNFCGHTGPNHPTRQTPCSSQFGGPTVGAETAQGDGQATQGAETKR